MGVNLGSLVSAKTISLFDLRGKTIVFDGYNLLYQFLSTIRLKNGELLKDSKGRVTSHLAGIFYRMCGLLENNIHPVIVLDGEPPEFKREELAARAKIRSEATEKWSEAAARGDLESAYKYARMSTMLSKDEVEDAIKLLDLMGIPVVQAPSEGEAQAAWMVKKGIGWGVGSQDWDVIVFGAPRVVRNIAISPAKMRENPPALVELETHVLNPLNITYEQLVDIAILIGTDYFEGIEGIGPKRAYSLIKEYGGLKALVEKGKIPQIEDRAWKAREFFMNPPVKDVTLEDKTPNWDGVIDFLCNEHDFSEERVIATVQKVKKRPRVQGTLW